MTKTLYGLDIDNRAYQLAYFAVMMKARQYNRRILNGETACHVYSIQESNGINRSQLKYFGAGMGDMERNTAMLQMQGLLDTFTDAKEYGSILNVENYNWQLLYQFVENVGMSGQMTLDTVGIGDTKNQLRLLVEIGATMAQKYDVAVTNPPYMGSSGMGVKLSDFVKENHPDSKFDLFAVFMECCGQMTKKNCYQAMITQHAWMFLSSFEKLREKMLRKDTVNMVHLGARAFEEIGGEVVQTTSFVLRNSHIKGYHGVYSRLVDYGSQKAKESAFLDKNDLHIANQENFSKIPGMPIAYWVSKNVIETYDNGKILGTLAFPKTGMTTGDNNRFLRLWQEIDITKSNMNALSSKDARSSNKKWFLYCKGGGFRRWYGYNEYLVNWENDGFEIKNNIKDNGLKAASVRSENLYFKELITWSAVTSGKFSCRAVDGGALFDSGGSSISVKSHSKYILALLNGVIGQYYLNISNATINYQPGDIASIPVLLDNIEVVEKIAQDNIELSKRDWDSYEISLDFSNHPFIANKSTAGYAEVPVSQWSGKIESAYNAWETVTRVQFNQLKSNEEELNRIFIEIYGLQDELNPEVEDKDVTIHKADLGMDVRSFISYAVGCMFGRYSLDVDGLAYAGGDWNDSIYNTFIPDIDNIIPITDEEYFEDDVVGLFCVFLKKTFGAETLEENLDFIAKALGNKGNSSRGIIRNYFLNDFFKDHCKIYRKRPIYWLFDSGKADGFKALVYMHRYNADTIGNLRIDYLHRMQRIYESEISRMQETIENSTNAREVTAAQRRKGKLTKQLKETKEYDEKIAHLALARISIDLDDGVKVNYEKVQTGTDRKRLEVLAKI